MPTGYYKRTEKQLIRMREHGFKKGRLSPYKGKRREITYCVDCKKRLCPQADRLGITRCRTCKNIFRTKSRELFCLDCGKKLCSGAFWDNTKRCNKCNNAGKRNPAYGKKQSVETVLKRTAQFKGELHWAYGKTFSEEHIIKLRNSHIGQIVVHSEATKLKISKAHKGKPKPWLQRQKHPNWKGGISFEPYPLGWTKTYREQIRYRDGYKCQICGVPEAECTRKLHVHHIDYIKKNINPDNLISLCIGCHMKTNYNRDMWVKLFMLSKPKEQSQEVDQAVEQFVNQTDGMNF